MTTEEIINDLLERNEFPPPPPRSSSSPIDTMNEGMGAVLHYLEQSGVPVTAGAISTATGVSTARIAVLLKKLDEKGLITRSSDKKDARKSFIALSEDGIKITSDRKKELTDLLTAVCNKVGPERVRLMMDLQEEINAAVEQYIADHPRPDI